MSLSRRGGRVALTVTAEMDGGASGSKQEPDPDADMFDSALLEQLESLGFPRLASKKALWATGGSAE